VPDRSAFDSRQVVDRITAAVRRGELTLPPLPEASTRLLRLLMTEEYASVAAVTKLLNEDAAMAADVLRAANSTYFGRLGRCSNLDQAVTRLGLRQVQVIVTRIAHQSQVIFEDEARLALLQDLSAHAMTCAYAARQIATDCQLDATEAYLAGLLHDSGKLVVLRGVQWLEDEAGHSLFTIQALEGMMEYLHTELGDIVLRSWGIPEPICRAARHHHDPPSPDDVLLLVVQAADLIAMRLSAGQNPTSPVDSWPFELLKIDADRMNTMVASVEQELKGLRSGMRAAA
jgi:HD-like signal output (HDOD) protein